METVLCLLNLLRNSVTRRGRSHRCQNPLLLTFCTLGHIRLRLIFLGDPYHMGTFPFCKYNIFPLAIAASLYCLSLHRNVVKSCCLSSLRSSEGSWTSCLTASSPLCLVEGDPLTKRIPLTLDIHCAALVQHMFRSATLLNLLNKKENQLNALNDPKGLSQVTRYGVTY